MRAASVALGLALLAAPAWAQAPGHASAWTAVTCDRTCLIGHLRAYMALKLAFCSRESSSTAMRSQRV